jgi:hypothetical protein
MITVMRSAGTALLAGALLVGSGTAAVAAPGSPAAKVHACTKDSKHHCIRGGEFCPQAAYGHSGWDAKGRRYVCKGNHTHPHWSKP